MVPPHLSWPAVSQISNLTVVSSKQTVCVRKAAPMVDSCDEQDQSVINPSFPSELRVHLELVELAFYKAKDQRRLSNCWLSWRWIVLFKWLLKPRKWFQGIPLHHYRAYIWAIHTPQRHILADWMHLHLLLITQFHSSTLLRNRFLSGERGMTQTSTIGRMLDSPKRTSLNWQILACPPPGLWAADILDKKEG